MAKVAGGFYEQEVVEGDRKTTPVTQRGASAQ
jgi:hypothetical protein